MKKIIVSLLTFLIAIPLVIAQPKSPRKVQLVILFDTSNSMDGLIEQAKARIWAIVNETSNLRHNGLVPTIEIAVYDYGNSGITIANYVRQQTPFTTNLDLISEKLFSLRTNGGEEYCGAVIQKSIEDLTWSPDPLDLKLVYIAGNEPFNQGPIDYKKVCEIASSKGIFVNTIYCGDYAQGIREFWKDGATCSKGEYFNINSNEKIDYIETPYDAKIQEQNNKLNSTYVGFGSQATYNFSNQMVQDKNAISVNSAVSSERIIVKSKKAAYNNASWDAVDAIQADSTFLQKVKEDDLPSELKGKTTLEQEKYIQEKAAERSKIQEEIGRLAKEREAYIQAEKAKGAQVKKADDFGTAVSKSLKEKAKTIGYE